MPGGEDRYHWGLMTGLKEETEGATGIQYHTKNDIVESGQLWVYQQCEVPLTVTNMLLVKVVVGKVKSMHRLQEILRARPIVQDDPAWNCMTWVNNALIALNHDMRALGTCLLDWVTVRNAAMRYCQEKKDQHRFDGLRPFDISKVAAFDLLEGREAII
ncbi:hypothetical protein MMC13_000606 [Lambiella insularis]|nr:hypothetical protein [Lambiella insularis]